MEFDTYQMVPDEGRQSGRHGVPPSPPGSLHCRPEAHSDDIGDKVGYKFSETGGPTGLGTADRAHRGRSGPALPGPARGGSPRSARSASLAARSVNFAQIRPLGKLITILIDI